MVHLMHESDDDVLAASHICEDACRWPDDAHLGLSLGQIGKNTAAFQLVSYYNIHLACYLNEFLSLPEAIRPLVS